MLKSKPDRGPAKDLSDAKPPSITAEAGDSVADGQAAAPAERPVPGIFTGPLRGMLTGDRRDQRESAKRHAHRLRMKEYFARAKAAI